ncbi:DNA polymerase IV [Paenibacillus athensensis]|uniref:DNA polymerase IV n=1 Tax=Paenibacillus athensensis TaxID=1967502 RepID=A0A4Y8PWQ1_9BACL|nr:DNA polymerase IV [Paenibacillus athensensis]MCD1257884.1 DNA polymerase IV [Paenibacillus athensensis]
MSPSNRNRVILLADCESFYASVEKAANPAYAKRPLVVASEPSKASGLILAACPIAKTFGISTTERLGAALAKCPELVIVPPRMQTYINISLLITGIFEQFTELVEPYSIDEQFLDLSGSLSLWGGSPEAIASHIQQRVLLQTGVWTRIGIGPTKVLAKMACDLFAKKRADGLYTLRPDLIPDTLWPQPVRGMFGVGPRMAGHLTAMGLQTIGDVAGMPLPRLKDKLRARLGRSSNVQAEVLWRTANGLDDSPVTPRVRTSQHAIGHHITLPREYAKRRDIETILLELCEEVCRRCRARRFIGNVVSVGAQSEAEGKSSSFYRQVKLLDGTSSAGEVFQAAIRLFDKIWDGSPIRGAAVALSGLSEDRGYQLTMFDDRPRLRELERVTDDLKTKYGSGVIARASTLLESSQFHTRLDKIGGHDK